MSILSSGHGSKGSESIPSISFHFNVPCGALWSNWLEMEPDLMLSVSILLHSQHDLKWRFSILFATNELSLACGVFVTWTDF